MQDSVDITNKYGNIFTCL